MADGPNAGYATLSVIPTLKGVRKELESQLEDPLKQAAARAGSKAADELQDAFGRTELIDNPDRMFDGLDSAARRAGSDAADGLASNSSEFRSAGERLADAASQSFDLSPAADQAAGDLSRRLDGERSDLTAVGKRLGEAAGSGVEDGVKAVDPSDLRRSVEGESSRMKAAGGALGDAVVGGVEQSLQSVNDLLSGLGEDLSASSVDAGQSAGSNIGSGIVSGLAEAGVEIAGEFAELGVEAAGQGSQLGASAAGGVTSGLAEGLAGSSDIFGNVISRIPKAAGASILAAGAASATLLAQGFSDSLERAGLESRFEAALGVDEAAAARLGAATGEIYASNWGDSLGQVAEAQRLAVQLTAGLGDQGEEELRQIAEAALVTSSVFDQDLRGSIRAAAQLVRTGLAKDFTEAFDLITVGLQGPANASDDLLDTFNEYSTQFRKLGLEGPEALGLISQAVQNGARDSDVAADALKEFAIRAVDGSEQTAYGFGLIGASADDMSARIAAGGDSASAALAETLDGLRQIPDPALRSQAAVALFGTQAEDLGNALYAMDLDTAASQLGDVDGAAQGAADSFDDVSSKVSQLGRELRTEAGDWVTDVLGPLATAADEDSTAEDFGRSIAAGVKRGLDLVPFSGIVEGWADFANVNLPGPTDILDAIFGKDVPEPPQRLKDVLDDVQATRAAAEETAGPLGVLGVKAEEMGNKVAGASVSLDEMNDLLALSAELSDLAGERAANYLDRIGDSSNLDDAISAQLDLRDASAELLDGLTALQGVDIQGFADGTVQVSDEAAAALGDISGAASAAQQQIADALQWEGADAAVAKAGDIRDGFVEMFNAVGLTDEQIIELLNAMGLLPDQVNTAITLSGADEAMAKLTLLNDFYKNPDGSSKIPEEVTSQINVAIAEGRFVDAANLLSIWVQDTQDGFVDNPLLVAMGLGDTKPATDAVAGWKQGEETKPPARVPVGTNTDPADIEVFAWRLLLGNTQTDTLVGANTGPGLIAVDDLAAHVGGLNPKMIVDVLPRYDNGLFRLLPTGGGPQWPGGRDGNPATPYPRAAGGPINAGDLYMVGENEPELFVSDRAGQILNQRQIRDGLGTTKQKSGAVYNIDVSGSEQPRATAREIFRAARRQEHLAGTG